MLFTINIFFHKRMTKKYGKKFPIHEKIRGKNKEFFFIRQTRKIIIEPYILLWDLRGCLRIMSMGNLVYGSLKLSQPFCCALSWFCFLIPLLFPFFLYFLLSFFISLIILLVFHPVFSISFSISHQTHIHSSVLPYLSQHHPMHIKENLTMH